MTLTRCFCSYNPRRNLLQMATPTKVFLYVAIFSLYTDKSAQTDKDIRRASAYDILDQSDNSYNDNFNTNYPTLNMVHEFSIADERNGTKRLPWRKQYDILANNQSSFSNYNYEIAATVQRISHGKAKVGLVAYKTCTSNHVNGIKQYLHQLKAAVFCHEVSERHYDPIDFMEALHIRGIKTVALLLPWYLVETILMRIANGHIDHVVFITLEAPPSYLGYFQRKYPRLEITNLMPLGSNKLEVNWNKKSLSIDSTYCVLIQNGKHGKHDIQFGNKMACTENIEQVINIVTIEHERYVFVIPERVSFNGNCVSGIPCKVPSRDGISTKWEWLCCAGLYIDIFQLILQEMNFSYELYVVEDGKFGAYRNGSWNGMIYDVSSKKADIALQQVTVLAQRYNVVDYTHRVYSSRIPLGIVIRNTNSEYVVINWSFIDSLNHNLLVAVSGTTTLILLVIFVLENIGEKCSLARMRRYSIGDSLSYVNGILYQRDIGGIHPRRWPGKVVAIIFAYGMTVMIGTYTAQLTASNIAIDEIDKFEGFKDKSFQNLAFKVGVEGSSSYEYFLEQEGIRVTKVIIDNWREGIESVYNRSIDAFVAQANSLDSMISNKIEYCEELLLYREHKYVEDMAFAFQKGSRIGEKVSAAILRLTEKDVIREIIQKWEDAQSCKDTKRKYHRFPWQYGGGLCVIAGIAIAACVFLLILEHIYKYMENYRNQEYNVNGSRYRTS